MSYIFEDRMKNKKELKVNSGETLEEVLLRNHIPPCSVITLSNGHPICENHVINENKNYVSKLIEGYDISNIIDTVFPLDVINADYVKKRITMNIDGSLEAEIIPYTYNEVIGLVDESIGFAVANYKMINHGDKVLIGLSGGVDSSSLLLSLNSLSKKMGFEIIAATFEDFDSVNSPTFANAKALCEKLGIEHKLINAEIVTETFNLTKSIREILPQMMGTKYSHFAMYADHHTTRRALEVFADEVNANKIVLGLHTTDLVAGLLNSFTTGYSVADIFKRKIGSYEYIYPLAFVPKKELHLYYYAKTGKYAEHSFPNKWEIDPKDRNYYYYLADVIQSTFAGIENYLFEANSWRNRRQKPLMYTKCSNCGSHILQQGFAPVNEDNCDVCRVFKELGYIEIER